MSTRPTILSLLMTTCFSTVAFTATATDCTEYDPFVAAAQSDDYETALQYYETLEINPGCTQEFRDWAESYLARASFLRAATSDGSAAEKAELLERALSFEKHWRTFSELGRLAWDGADYDLAAGYFQAAINQLIDGPESHHATTEEVEEVYRLATASVALANEVVQLPTTRSGAPGGILVASVRGFVVEEVSLPITFRYGEDNFDERGQLFADKLIDHLNLTGATRITLGGHTDPRGSDEFNLKLSEDRTKALEKYLKSNGFEGEVDLNWFGESRPPHAVPGIDPESEEFFQLSRRVVFSIG